ncbi:DNA-(apurinic or apyrimidinic site) endonuclease 2 [Erysiphe necator]|nr:DNA-(apurinic or apyrimidinic site) endonuclease 2 [Erysiphe necator]
MLKSYIVTYIFNNVKSMFNILEADIVILQEIKIQRKDLQDDMVLIPGWDVFFSFPKHKKGYSGVAIYTRSDFCAPIRAEEGITGILTPPKSSTSFRDLPIELQIGGYPTSNQLSNFSIDASSLDSEGRCVIIEFPAFVLIGTYCPASRDCARDEFRLGFLNALDARVRNLVNAGKRVFLAGDLNIVREEIDSIYTEEAMKKNGSLPEGFLLCPIRRIFNQMVLGGKVIGDRDLGREKPVLLDICRYFHPSRHNMFTCWDQKTNSRPGNLGSRIDYVLCSEDWKDWFCDSNIQEGLMGSDHCPVYAVLNKIVHFDSKVTDIKDIMSVDFFKNGVRQRHWCPKDLLPLSGKLIPEFDRRRSIKDMFAKSMKTGIEAKSNLLLSTQRKNDESQFRDSKSLKSDIQINNVNSVVVRSVKRGNVTSTLPFNPQKRLKPTISDPKTKPDGTKRGQVSLAKFFKKSNQENKYQSACHQVNLEQRMTVVDPASPSESPDSSNSLEACIHSNNSLMQCDNFTSDADINGQKRASNTPDTKENWAKLLSKHETPRCKHGEPCISLVTKKPGINHGRSFYICPRPIGPSGQDEKDSIWRCSTFIWNSDLN